jgi:diguanylate cyclase (GGDEF)-like protein
MIENVDALTGLHPRSSFLPLLGQQIIRASELNTRLALVVFDIDNFAQINVTYGYSHGDVVLRYLAKQLRSVARKQDQIARIGDNRFALLLSRVLNRGHAELAIQKLKRLLEAPLEIGEHQVSIRVTAGAALCPDHASHAEFLLRKAETALASARREHEEYHVLENGSGNELELSAQWELEVELGSAIDRGELQMHYQPQIDIRNGRPVGAEALMRWVRHGSEVISPDVFIPLAERTGKIKKITIWALNTALRRAGEWRSDLGTLTIALNLPGELATQRDLPELVENALRLWGKPHVRLTLEITERSLMDRQRGRDILMQLRRLGVGISIDDFGTGYSCLAYFKNLPVDELKVDKSFVSELLTDSASLDITTLIIDLAHRFELSVVAEGVENARTLQVLRQHGCDMAQGFLFGHPMPSNEFQRWLLDYQPADDAPSSTPPD